MVTGVPTGPCLGLIEVMAGGASSVKAELESLLSPTMTIISPLAAPSGTSTIILLSDRLTMGAKACPNDTEITIPFRVAVFWAGGMERVAIVSGETRESIPGKGKLS